MYMKIFSKRETLLQNMALMGIMSAINIIISLISAFVPVISVFLILILPLTSTLVELYCKDRYYPIYALATIGLSLVATLWNMDTTIFYLVPSVLTGYVFGLMAKKKMPSIWSIFLTAIVQASLSIAFIPLINFLFQVDIVMTFKTFLNLQDSININTIVPSFIFTISMIQMSLSYSIIANEINKFGYNESQDEKYKCIYQLAGLICSIAIIPFAFFYLEASYVFLMFAIFFTVFIIVDFFYQKAWHLLIISGIGLLINFVLFVIFYIHMPGLSGFLLLGITPIWITLLALLVSFLKRDKKHIK